MKEEPVSLLEPDNPAEGTILIVDDSVTTRTLEKTILESQGYRVHLAVDGMDNILRKNRKIKIFMDLNTIRMRLYQKYKRYRPK